MKFTYLILFILFNISCTTTKIIEVASSGGVSNLQLLKGEENAIRNYLLIQEKIKNTNSTVVDIRIPSGEFYIDGTIHNENNKRILLSGVDKFLTKLIFFTHGKSAIEFSKNGSSYLYGSKITNISLCSEDAESVLKIEKQRGFRLLNVNIIGGKIGIHIDFVYDLLISDVYVSQFIKSGINISDKNGSNTTIYIEHSHIEGNGDAIHVKGVGGLRLDKTIIQSNKRGIIEKDGIRGSSIYIRDSHFEGNHMECFYQERSFKPGKSPSFISIENTMLLRGPQTEQGVPIAYMNFGSIYIYNSNMSYAERVDRNKDSIGKFYSTDKVVQYRYENPKRPNFIYKNNPK